MQLTAEIIARGFNTVNTVKSRKARPFTKSEDDIEQVHFTTGSDLIELIYHVKPARFEVKFVKVTASWGDYVHAAARCVHAISTTLKKTALPFPAPDGYSEWTLAVELDGEEGSKARTFVSYVPPVSEQIRQAAASNPYDRETRVIEPWHKLEAEQTQALIDAGYHIDEHPQAKAYREMLNAPIKASTAERWPCPAGNIVDGESQRTHDSTSAVDDNADTPEPQDENNSSGPVDSE